jgi:hypothetical protein
MRRGARWDRDTRRRPQTGRFGVGNGAKRRFHVARGTNAAPHFSMGRDYEHRHNEKKAVPR